jgi:hypothetical protein
MAQIVEQHHPAEDAALKSWAIRDCWLLTRDKPLWIWSQSQWFRHSSIGRCRLYACSIKPSNFGVTIVLIHSWRLEALGLSFRQSLARNRCSNSQTVIYPRLAASRRDCQTLR